MSNLKILIIEDEVIIANGMKLMLETMGYTLAGMARNRSKALEMLMENKPDLAVVDINLGSGSEGIEIGKFISEQFRIPFIFCTSYSDNNTIQQAKEVKPNGYLLKPFTKDDLYVAIEMALVNFTHTPASVAAQSENASGIVLHDCFFVKDKDVYNKVSFDEVVYLQQDRNYIDVHTVSQRIYVVRSTLKEFVKNLPEKKFIQVHRSYVINASLINSITSDKVTLNGKEVPVSKTYREELIKNIRRFL